MLTERLFKLESFQKQYKYLLILSVSLIIDKLVWNEEREVVESKINWNNILSISRILYQI